MRFVEEFAIDFVESPGNEIRVGPHGREGELAGALRLDICKDDLYVFGTNIVGVQLAGAAPYNTSWVQGHSGTRVAAFLIVTSKDDAELVETMRMRREFSSGIQNHRRDRQAIAAKQNLAGPKGVGSGTRRVALQVHGCTQDDYDRSGRLARDNRAPSPEPPSVMLVIRLSR